MAIQFIEKSVDPAVVLPEGVRSMERPRSARDGPSITKIGVSEMCNATYLLEMSIFISPEVPSTFCTSQL